MEFDRLGPRPLTYKIIATNGIQRAPLSSEDENWLQLHGDPNALVRLDLERHLSRTFLSVGPKSRTAEKLEADHFKATWNTLAGPSTTMDADLYLIFANIHNLRTEILPTLLTTSQKLRCIALSFKSLPTSLLFCTAQTKQQKIPCPDAWIPLEFGRELLTGSSLMRLDRTCNVLYFSGLDNDCDVFTVPSTLLYRTSCVVVFDDATEVASVERYFDKAVSTEIPFSQACLVI
jgi:hypothetical protein